MHSWNTYAHPSDILWKGQGLATFTEGVHVSDTAVVGCIRGKDTHTHKCFDKLQYQVPGTYNI